VDKSRSDSTKTGTTPRPERLVFLPVVAALLGAWIMLAAFTYAARDLAIERATGQLTMTVMTLADFNELAEQATGEAVLTSSEQRTAAIWRALLQYPTASIWVESDGVVSGGQPPLATAEASILAAEDRGTFAVHASMSEADALVEWRRSVRWRSGIMLAITVAFLGFTVILSRAQQQRTAAEHAAIAASEREGQLLIYRKQLEETVALRTGELKSSNALLERELNDRKAAELQLQQHDALLHAVTKSAAELLGAQSLAEATTAVLELIGQTVGVSRVHINEISTDRDGHLRSSVRYEWCAPGMRPMVDDLQLQDVDLTVQYPNAIAPLLTNKLTSLFIDDVPGEPKHALEEAGMRSSLQIPVLVEDSLWGSLNFIDSSVAKRQWNWAETDTLQTLAGLIGVAIARARYVKELADANMIVQNSPTILYRLDGKPSFPLTYVSHNITKFGHDPKQLIGVADWADVLMEPEDRDRCVDAMARMVDKHAVGASIEFRMRMADGQYRWVENRYTPVRDKDGRLAEIEGMIIDVTERKAAEEKIALLARTDGLTGLANRTTFIDRIRQAFSSVKRGAQAFAIMYMDIDHFKQINDTLGHAVGDQLLRAVADRLRGCTREGDVVARLGGDEFAILQTEINEAAQAGALAATLLKELTRPYSIDGNDLHMTVSIGICPYDADSVSPDAMLTQADLALYRSKEEGRNCYRFHSADLDDQVLDRVTLVDEIRKAIENHEFDLYYQPQVELDSGKIVGMEALVRWRHPKRGLLPAASFVPVAEKTGTIIALGKWVLERACRQMKEWRDAGMKPPVMTMNLSLAQLKNRRELINDVVSNIEKYGLAPADISFDVTEATLAQATLMQNDVLAELRQLGIRIAIDDFGSAYSSFDYLRTYRVNQLKMSQSYLEAAHDDEERAATVRAIIGLARELGIDVITNGVETVEQRDRSSETSTIAQGLFFSDALDVAEANKLLRRGSIDWHGETSRTRKNA
jgi:diguanylate cyclase (GGDEF)-like protein/PAS domain S-box-containing protein